MTDRRMEICLELGLGDVIKTYELIVAGARKGPQLLLQKGLNARLLAELGYDAGGMQRLGYSGEALERLGYRVASAAGSSAGASRPQPAEPAPRHESAGEDETTTETIRRLVEQGLRASGLSQLGYTPHLVRRVGFSALEMAQIGYGLEELVSLYSAAELRRADFRPGELRRYFTGDELRRAGFSATDMRQAGYSVRELLNLGYNENHVRIAGFSMAELMREGLSKTTRTL